MPCSARLAKYYMDKLRIIKLNNIDTIRNNYIIEEVYGLGKKKQIPKPEPRIKNYPLRENNENKSVEQVKPKTFKLNEYLLVFMKIKK